MSNTTDAQVCFSWDMCVEGMEFGRKREAEEEGENMNVWVRQRKVQLMFKGRRGRQGPGWKMLAVLGQ